jgi:hypothetical protein
MSVHEFKAQSKTFLEQGLRLTDLVVENGKFAAVWHPGSGQQRWLSSTVDTFEQKDSNEFFKKGLRLEVLERFELDDPTNVPPPGYPEGDSGPDFPQW